MTPESLLRQDADDLAIRKTIARLSRAQDDENRKACKVLFHRAVAPRQSVMLTTSAPLDLPVDQLARRHLAAVDSHEVTRHFVTTHVIDVDGDAATCLADLYSVAGQRQGAALSPVCQVVRYDPTLECDGERWLTTEMAMGQRYAIAGGEFVSGEHDEADSDGRKMTNSASRTDRSAALKDSREGVT